MRTLLFILATLIIITTATTLVYAGVDAATDEGLTTDYEHVRLDNYRDYVNDTCTPMLMYCIDNGELVAFWIAQDASGTGAKYIPAGTSYSNSCVSIDSDGYVGWFKAASGTPTLYIDPGRKER